MRKKLEMATGIRPFQYELVADIISLGIDWESSSDEELMRIVVVMLVFIVYCDVCDTTCCCVLFKCTYVHCLCSLCVAPTFPFEGIKKFLT